MRHFFLFGILFTLACAHSAPVTTVQAISASCPIDTPDPIARAADGSPLFESDLLSRGTLPMLDQWKDIRWNGIFEVKIHASSPSSGIIFLTSVNNLVLEGLPKIEMPFFATEEPEVSFFVPKEFYSKIITEIRWRGSNEYYAVWHWNSACTLYFRPTEYVGTGSTYYWARTGKEYFAGYVGTCPVSELPRDYRQTLVR